MKISKLELKRQAFHICFGLIMVALLYYNIIGATTLFIILMVGFAFSMIYRKKQVPIISHLLKHFDREKSKFPGEGAFFMVAGIFLVYGVFPKDIALAAIMILTLGDSFAHLLGKNFGKRNIHKNTNKTWLGTISGLIAGTIGAMLFVSLGVAFIGAVVAMLLEAIELKYMKFTLDDNLLVPVVAAIAMHLWVIL